MTLRRFSIIVCALLSFTMSHFSSAADLREPSGLLRYVNTLQGTDSNHDLSYGNTLPLVCVPWGMTNWTPQTVEEGNWFFEPGRRIDGFRATRQPSPWIGDYGQFILMPQSGALRVGREERTSEYDAKGAIFRPDYFCADLQQGQITAEMTASQRCGVFRFTFHNSKTGRLIIKAAGVSHIEIGDRIIRGYSRFATGGAGDNFFSYFVIELDRPIRATGTFIKDDVAANTKTVNGTDVGGYVEFDLANQPAVEARVGTSFISFEQAQRNLDTEAAGGFDAVQSAAAAEWEKNFSKIEIEASEEQKKTFYSCFYRAMIFPHRLYEIDAKGKPTHYSPYDSKIHPGILYGDCGTWDMFRTTFPLYTILFPKQFGEMLQGWVQAGIESGEMPEWPSPGTRVCMVGQHSAAMFADAVAKGITSFDVKKAYQLLREMAFAEPAHTPKRAGLADYLSRGYIPTGHATYASSATLDYAYDDWCIAQIAKRQGDQSTYDTLMKRAQNYRNLWRSDVGFTGAKNPDGTWVEPFDQFYWGGPYVEGGPWQNSWAVQHDAIGLASLLGGPAKLAAKLDEMLATPPTFHVGGYGIVIHEMTEMALAHFGQYAQSNEPVFHVLYLYAAVGYPWKTEKWTRKVCEEMYNSSPRGFPGDEDTGTMAAWYILSSLGIYPLCPGDPNYILTSPLFTKSILHLPNGKTFSITAADNDSRNIYVQSRRLNGSEYRKTFIPHAVLLQGGSMDMQMADKPAERVLNDDELPYSASRNSR
jgi:predicted alpha-1,2-mannosidase